MLSVDASIRLEKLEDDLGSVIRDLEHRIDDAAAHRKQSVAMLSSRSNDKDGPEIRQILSGKSPEQVAKLAESELTADHILTALAHPVAELLGVTAKDRENIQQRLIQRDPTYREAVEQAQLADDERSSIRKQVSDARYNIEQSLQMHRQRNRG